MQWNVLICVAFLSCKMLEGLKIGQVLHELLEDPVISTDLLTMNLEGRFYFRKKLPRMTRFTTSQKEKERLETVFGSVLKEQRKLFVQAMAQETETWKNEEKDIKGIEMIQLEENLRKGALNAIYREEYQWKLMYHVIQIIIGKAAGINDLTGIDHFIQSHEDQILKHYETYKAYCGAEEMKKNLRECLNESQYGGFVSRIQFWVLAVQMFGSSRANQQIPQKIFKETNRRAEVKVFEWPEEFNFKTFLEEAEDDFAEARRRMLNGLDRVWEGFSEYKKNNPVVAGVGQFGTELVTRISFVKNAILKEPVEFYMELHREKMRYGDLFRRLRMFERFGHAALDINTGSSASDDRNNSVFIKLLSIAQQMFETDQAVRFETHRLPEGFKIPGYEQQPSKDQESRRRSWTRILTPIDSKQVVQEQICEQQQEEFFDFNYEAETERTEISAAVSEAYGVNSDIFDTI